MSSDDHAEVAHGFEELERARAALGSAGIVCHSPAEEVGDGICRLAGERDELRAMVDEMGKALGHDMRRPDARAQVVRTVMHIAARQPAVAPRPAWPSWPALVGRILPCLLLLALPGGLLAQTTPIRHARIYGTSAVTGTLNLSEAQIAWPSPITWSDVQARSYATTGGWSWSEPATGTFRIATPAGLQLDLIQQSNGTQDVLYFPGTIQAGSISGDGTGITALAPSTVGAALAGANPVYLNAVANAAQADGNVVMQYADTTGGLVTYSWASRTPANAATVLGVGTSSAASFGSVKVAGGTALLRMRSATATLDFPAIAAASEQALTVAVTGAAVNDAVVIGLPDTPASGVIFAGFVSAAGTVTVRATNVTGAAIDPAAATYRVAVFGF